MPKIVAGTGHRPDKLGNSYDTFGPLAVAIIRETGNKLKTMQADRVISGMALGFDQWLARVAVSLGIPFTAAVPFRGQETAWRSKQSVLDYHWLLERAESVVFCDELLPDNMPGYAAWKMQHRNQWMADNSTVMLACWNGDKHGGTYRCLRYCREINRDVVRIDPRDLAKSLSSL